MIAGGRILAMLPQEKVSSPSPTLGIPTKRSGIQPGLYYNTVNYVNIYQINFDKVVLLLSFLANVLKH